MKYPTSMILGYFKNRITELNISPNENLELIFNHVSQEMNNKSENRCYRSWLQ